MNFYNPFKWYIVVKHNVYFIRKFGFNAWDYIYNRQWSKNYYFEYNMSFSTAKQLLPQANLIKSQTKFDEKKLKNMSKFNYVKV